MSKTDIMETHVTSTGEAGPIAKTPRTDQRDSHPEDCEWFRYVTSLSPHGENGAFLTPDELLDVNIAFDRLQSANGGTPRKPSDGKTVADEDDEFIKKQMSTAFRLQVLLKLSGTLFCITLARGEILLRESNAARSRSNWLVVISAWSHTRLQVSFKE